jgi:hypothetical protein
MPTETNIPTSTTTQDPPITTSTDSQSGNTTPQSEDRFSQLEKRLADDRQSNSRELAELRATNARVLALLEAQNAPKPAPPVYPDTKGFLDNPLSHMDELITRRISEGLERAIKPLNQYAAIQLADTQYNNLKAGLRQKYGAKFSDLENEIDNVIRSGIPAGTPITEDAVQAAFRLAYGDAVLQGRVPGGNPQANNRNVTPVTHVPTSPAPDGRRVPQTVEMTETERYLFNRAKANDPTLTEEEWSKLTNAGVGKDGISASVKIGQI